MWKAFVPSRCAQDKPVSEPALVNDSFIMIERRCQNDQSVPEPFRQSKLNGIDLFEITVDELQHHFVSGQLNSKEYAAYCIEAVRKANPYLECVIEVNPDALEIAANLDQERQDNKVRGPLHGVPVLVKDNMATAEKMQTTAGSWALLGSKVPKDAHIVHLLRNAGAIILGKTNMDEWAGIRCHSYSTAYSPRGGQCRNPYRLNRSPEGSSSGSAVAVSANLVPLAFGSETDCSIISPATVNGIVGIKPTVGLTSRAGVVPISETQDSTGPFGRTVADCARALDVIVGEDADDKFSSVPGRDQVKSYYSCLTDRNILNGARFGLPMKRFWEVAPAPQRKVVERILGLLRKAGAQIIEVDMPCAEERLAESGEWNWERYGESCPEKSEITVMKVQTYYMVQEYLSKLENTSMKTLDDIVKFNNMNRGSEGGHAYDIPAFPEGQSLLQDCVKTRGIKTDIYHAALKHIQSQCRENGIDAALDHEGELLDALLFCDIKRGGIQIAAQAGYPVLSLPVGLDPDGMPVSLVLIQSAWQDDKLVRWASAIEDMLQYHNSSKGLRRADTSLHRSNRLGRVPPLFINHLAKNIPIDKAYRYEGAQDPCPNPWPDRSSDPECRQSLEETGDDDDDSPRARYIV